MGSEEGSESAARAPLGHRAVWPLYALAVMLFVIGALCNWGSLVIIGMLVGLLTFIVARYHYITAPVRPHS